MTIQTLTLTGYPSGETALYLYSPSLDLDDYETIAVLMAEGTGSNIGRYSADWDPANGTSIVAFIGAIQPASWSAALAGISWDLSNTADALKVIITDILANSEFTSDQMLAAIRATVVEAVKSVEIKIDSNPQKVIVKPCRTDPTLPPQRIVFGPQKPVVHNPYVNLPRRN